MKIRIEHGYVSLHLTANTLLIPVNSRREANLLASELKRAAEEALTMKVPELSPNPEHALL